MKTPARLETEYIYTNEGMICLDDLNAAAVKIVLSQCTVPSEVRERAGGRRSERIYSSKSTLESLPVFIMRMKTRTVNRKIRLVNV